MRVEELQVLRMRLMSGEYDGVHIMQAAIAIDSLIKVMNGVGGVSDDECECENLGSECSSCEVDE